LIASAPRNIVLAVEDPRTPERPKSGTSQYLRDGEIMVSETAPDVWFVGWYPHRRDHPDYPGVTTDSTREPIPTEGGADETRDERIVAEVILEEEAGRDEVEAIEAFFDEAGVPSVVTARIGRRSAGPLAWTLLIEAPIGVFLNAGGEGSWGRLRTAQSASSSGSSSCGAAPTGTMSRFSSTKTAAASSSPTGFPTKASGN
jgi:hypothetical protein